METKLAQLELILNSEKQKTVGASIMKHAAAFLATSCFVVAFLKDNSHDDDPHSTRGVPKYRGKKILQISWLPLLAVNMLLEYI